MLHSESEPRLYSVSRLLCGISAHTLCAAFTVLIAALAKPGSSLFSWHPFLMTLAFSFFMTEAVLLFSPHSSPVAKLKHPTKARLHWILQCLSACCAAVGLGAIFYNKHLNGKPHFASWHGLIGVITVGVVVIQSVGALPLLYHKLAKGWSLAKLKRYHAASGLLTYLLGSASLLLGTCSAWFTGSVSGYVWYLAAFCPTLSALVVMSQVTNAYMAKKRLQY
ncbi:cytochrome b561 domain-containing protein 2 [Pygocentrus nattereri]|uniref:ascorbate ferrireductase (transmembrane) n=1 Tax=Pygocentrus nattereri TaxID=42514 RepID=A0AAR2LVZ3_PYGNA|nr:cytochrome b561 domain-containing protein 2 [Pygocentrus nattereri]